MIPHFLIFIQGMYVLEVLEDHIIKYIWIYLKNLKVIDKFCLGVMLLIPGLIHSYHPDGGAKSIADFTNYEKCQPEIMWYFRLLGKTMVK